MFRTNLTALEELNQENLDWSANRLLHELTSFQRELIKMEAGDPTATAASINRRYDILWSRLAQSNQGQVGERLNGYDQNGRVLQRLFKQVRDSENAVVNISPDDVDTLRRLRSEYLSFEPLVTDFKRTVFVGEQQRVAEVRLDINRSAFLTALATVAAFVTTGVALFQVSREARTNRQMAEDNLSLANAAEQANHAKSRFLTMMSHELRTPMNGVLGMLALTKQQGLPKQQLRLINQAETSGQQMIAMLSDILDYSAIQDNRMALENKPFEPAQLADAIRGLFGSVARREGINFNVDCADDCPERVSGDFRRLRQIVGHFASYIVETAGTEEIEIAIGHEANNLRVAISFDYSSLDGKDNTWHPEILLGTRQNTDDQFATDALGPAVARGVLEQMGGTIRLDHPKSDRIAILLTIPAEIVDIKVLNILIDTQSAALLTICKVALQNENTAIVESDSSEVIHKVLIEAGGHNELDRVQKMAARYPNALLIALGNPINPSDFDGSVAIPLDISELRDSVLESSQSV